MLTKSDIERFNSIMDSIMQRREDRGFNIPDRDEELISNILNKAERATMAERALLIEFN